MLNPGNVLHNRYRIASPLAKGGMGAVWRAWDTLFNLPVAIKVMMLPPGVPADLLLRLREQFFQEAQTLARLQHSNLVKVTDFFEAAGQDCIVMQFVDGESLEAQIARQGSLPEAQVRAWADQLLDALAYCHDNRVLHRDIKPANIIIQKDGRPVLVDFGLVKLWNPQNPHTKTGLSGIGTPAYAPPEQYSGGSDARTDLYSLGATLYHALTGQVPPSVTDRLSDPQRLTPPDSVNASVTPQTAAAVLKALSLARDQRPANAREMQALLKETRRNTALTPTVSLPRTGTRRAAGWWLVGAFALFLLAATTFQLNRFEGMPSAALPVSTGTEQISQANRDPPLVISSPDTPTATLPLLSVATSVLATVPVKTAVPPTPTPVRTWTPLPVADITLTPASAPTFTSVPAQTFSRVSAPTFTLVPAPTVTAAPLPTFTPAPPPTATPVPAPTSTPAPTPTLIPAQTATPACPAISGPFATVWSLIQNRIGCATGNVVQGLIAEQNFERGKMFWREPIDYSQALVLFNNGGWQIFSHPPYNEGSAEFSCPDENTPSQCPPTPRRGFGMMWCNIPEIRNGLGNAVDCERGYQGAMQQFQQGFMLQSDNGTIHVFYSTGQWERK